MKDPILFFLKDFPQISLLLFHKICALFFQIFLLLFPDVTATFNSPIIKITSIENMKMYSQIYLTFGAQSRHEGQIGSADLWKGEVCWSGLLESQSFESLRNFNRILKY